MKTEEIERAIDNLPHKENRRRRRIRVSKKMGIGIFAVLIAATLIASGTLLSYYGSIETTMNVKQSVQIMAGGESTWRDYNEPITSFVIPEEYPGGESFCYKFWVWNHASVVAPIWFETTPDYSAEGITTKVYEFPDDPVTLELTSKDSNWAPTNAMKATLTFNPISPTFDYDLTATGLANDAEYALIYYSDQDPRFGLWGGDGGIVIDTFTATGTTYTTPTTQSVNLGRNMPDGTDWNIHPSPDYCDNNNGYDDYDHGEGGAKIWIVLTSDLSGESLPLVNWNPTAWLFETDLISYSDCNLVIVPWTMSLWGTDVTSRIDILSGEKVPLFVCYAFDIAVPTLNQYVMTTLVKPLITL